MDRPISNILTVDVEDYYMVSAFSDVVRFDEWETFESRVERNTHKVLDILREYGVCGTFFVLGWVAEKFPLLLREIIGAGNEVACHGYRHEIVYEMGPERFREDTRKAKQIIEDTIGQKVAGYRAPSFSITRKNLWALDVLAESGFAYDSSIFPVSHDRYGYPQFSRFPKLIDTICGGILEIPPSTLRFAGRNIPFAGGGYFRLFPSWFTEWGIRTLNDQTAHPVVFYLHPWELDPGQPSIRGGRVSRFRHYLNLDKTEARLRIMLSKHRFASIRDVFGTTIEEGFELRNARREAVI